MDNAKTGSNKPGSSQQSQPAIAGSLNTRTMFFQPPPWRASFWPTTTTSTPTETITDSTRTQNVTDSSKTNTDESRPSPSEPSAGYESAQRQTVGSAGSGNTTNDLVGNNQAVQYETKLSDTNDPVYIQRSSEQTVYQHGPRQTTSRASSDQQQTNSNNGAPAQHQLGGSITLTNTMKGGSGYKRGTIIASATTSPNRGHGSRSTAAQYSSSDAPSSNMNHKSNALGVVLAAAGSSWLIFIIHIGQVF